tara:strand:- start:18 stop:704 length:687 start_codon:yes stop_codon:yes gene_type:complete
MNLTLQTISSTVISEILCKTNFDGVVLDTEHGCFNNENLYSCIQVITSMNKKCFVRVTDLNKRLIRMCLDAGVDGLIFSTVENINNAEEILKYCKYPRHGGNRGMGLVRQNSWGDDILDDHHPILIAQIETKKGVDNIDKLMEFGFDYFVLGPYDLSSDLNCPTDWENEKYLLHVDRFHDTIPQEKIGMFLPTVNQVLESKNETINYSFLVSGMDTDFLRTGIGECFK